LAEVLVTGENAKKSASTSNMTPLEILRNHAESPTMGFLPRFGPPRHPTAPRLGWVVLRLRIAGSQVGGKNPYIDHHGRQFSHTKMRGDWTYVDKYLMVHIRRADFFVEAYGPDGDFWGPMVQSGGSTKPTPYDTVVSIYRERNHVELPDEDEVDAYRRAKEEKAAEESSRRPKRISRAGTALAEHDRGMSAAKRVRDRTVKQQAEQAGVEARSETQHDEHAPDAAPKQVNDHPSARPDEEDDEIAMPTNIFALGSLGSRR
jgi:hypothetical protein